jgi:hypothetical protein
VSESAKEERRVVSAGRARWSYVVLAAFITLLFLILGIGGVIYVNNNNKAWCELIHASLPPKAPVLPENATADQLKKYTDYQIVVRLGHRFGCL